MARDIDDIIAGVRQRFHNVEISQLQVKYPGVDDDGIWYFSLRGVKGEIQIESSSGMCPFVIEHSEMRRTSDAFHADLVPEAIEYISAYLNARDPAESS